jgi:hypothetical protein
VGGNRDSHIRRATNGSQQELDAFDSAEFFFTRAAGVETALRGLAATNHTGISKVEHMEREHFAAVLIQDAKILINDLEYSPFRCVFQTGETLTRGHKLQSLGEERALFDAMDLAPGSWLELDYAEFHDAPQNAPQDLPHGLADRRQLYLGSTRAETAISAYQLSLALLNGGSWELGYKPMP